MWCASSARIYRGQRDQLSPRRTSAQRTYAQLECLPLVERQTITLGNDRNDVDNLAKLLHDGDVDRLKRVTSGSDEVEAAVDARVDDVLVTHRGELLAEIGRVLVLDVLDDRVPAVCEISCAPKGGWERRDAPVLVVDEITVARSVNDVQAQLDVVLLHDCCALFQLSRSRMSREREDALCETA